MNEKKSSFKHKFDVGDTVKYPDNSSLKEGSIDEVIFHKKEVRGRGNVEYLVIPKGRGTSKGQLRSENDLVST